MFGGFVAKANLNPVNAIHPRIAGRSAPQNLNAGARKEPKVGEVMAHLVWADRRVPPRLRCLLSRHSEPKHSSNRISDQVGPLYYTTSRGSLPDFMVRVTYWPSSQYFVGGNHGAPGRIRTSDLLVRSQALYPAELRAHIARMQLSKNNRWTALRSTLASADAV